MGCVTPFADWLLSRGHPRTPSDALLVSNDLRLRYARVLMEAYPALRRGEDDTDAALRRLADEAESYSRKDAA